MACGIGGNDDIRPDRPHSGINRSSRRNDRELRSAGSSKESLSARTEIEQMMTKRKALAPLPWRVAREWDGRHWTDSCSIFDADGGEVCVLTRGYQGGEDGDGCPSYDNAELIVAAVNAFANGEYTNGS